MPLSYRDYEERLGGRTVVETCNKTFQERIYWFPPLIQLRLETFAKHQKIRVTTLVRELGKDNSYQGEFYTLSLGPRILDYAEENPEVLPALRTLRRRNR